MKKFSLISPTNIKIAVVGNISNFLAIWLMGHDRSDHRAYCLPVKPTVFVTSLCGRHCNGNMYNFQLCMAYVHKYFFFQFQNIKTFMRHIWVNYYYI